MSEPAEEKIARLTRERDEMAAQASACAEEVDRVRVEIGAVQAEVEALKAERDAAQAMVRQTNDALITLTNGGPQFYIASEGGRVDAWGCVSYARDLHDRLHTALAESERKRVEAEADLADALATRDLLGRANVDRTAVWVENPTPTQETPHVEI